MASGPDHGEQHLEARDRLHGVRPSRGQAEQVARRDAVGRSRDRELGLALDHHRERVVRRIAGLAAAIENGACLIKPNREELCSLLGEATVNEQGVGQSARDLSRKYPSLTVLASDGAAGAYLATGTELFHGKCVGEIKVVNTVGAGDALLAGYLSGVAAGKSARESLAIALRAASSSLASVTAGTLSLDVMKNIAVAVASLGA